MQALKNHLFRMLLCTTLLVTLLAPWQLAAAQSDTTLYLPLIAGANPVAPPVSTAPRTDDSTWTTTASNYCYPDGLQQSGAIYRICLPLPDAYNGDLVIWAHGYVDPTKPVQIPENHLCFDGTCIYDVANLLGFGFITTSYSANGLAVRQGMDDIVDLIAIYTNLVGAPNRVFVLGVSEGGLITTLLVEERPDLFTGGLALCGPIGNFAKQVNYFGDFRVIFDYFFPGVLPGDVLTVPPELQANWDTYYETVVQPALRAPQNRSQLLQLLRVTKIPFDPNDLVATVDKSIRDALWYQVFSTEDAAAKLGGQPYDNHGRYYTGSLDDEQLNATVPRYTADAAALAEIGNNYETSGQLVQPLVTMHTLLDQQVPYWHEPLYRQKNRATETQFERVHIPVVRYQHCNFKLYEMLVGFGILYFRSTNSALDLARLDDRLPTDADRAALRRLAAEYDLPLPR